jgi:membrane protease YdiL (CAAX protease family)
MLSIPKPDSSLMSGAISIGSATLAFLIYHFSISGKKFNKRLQEKFGTKQATVRKVLFQRFLGAVLFGLFPMGIILFVFQRPLQDYGFATGRIMESILWWIPLAVVIVAIAFFGARNASNLAMYPQIRVTEWDRKLLALSALSWTAYLVGYEVLFRGFLLFSCLESFGYWPAIVINISLYSLFHIPKGSKEAIGSIFVGFILCYQSIYLGSLWFAIFVHVTMALSNEWFSLGYQPEMKLVKNRYRK